MRSSLFKFLTPLYACGIFVVSSPALATTSETQTLYVAPSGASGTGSASSPFALTSGREYAFNRLVRPYLDAGVPVKVIFLDGTYSDVRLQIIRQGVDTETIYLLQPPTVAGTTPSSYHTGAHCNSSGQNCRVLAADFTMGANTTTLLELVAEDAGRVVFDGTDTRDLRPVIDSEALTIAGSIFGGPAANPYNVKSQRISNVFVDGMIFTNYRNGVHLKYATDILVQDCTFQSIGNRIPRTSSDDQYGTFAVSVDSDTQLVGFYQNTIKDAWNVGGNGSYAAGAVDPGLMHSVYIGYSRDSIFKNNEMDGSSGPMIKWGFYPQVSGSTVYEYPTGAAARRNFFIENTFILDVAHDGPQAVASGSLGEAFVHDNSREVVGSGESAPAAGIVFLSNEFENELPLVDGLAVALLREETPLASDVPLFPAWSFQGNVITGIGSTSLIMTRQRGTALVASSFMHRTIEQDIATQFDLPSQILIGSVPSANWYTTLTALLNSSLKSNDPVEDASVLTLAQ